MSISYYYQSMLLSITGILNGRLMLYIDGILIPCWLAMAGREFPPWRHGGLIPWQAIIELFMVAFPAMEPMTPEGRIILTLDLRCSLCTDYFGPAQTFSRRAKNAPFCIKINARSTRQWIDVNRSNMDLWWCFQGSFKSIYWTLGGPLC